MNDSPQNVKECRAGFQYCSVELKGNHMSKRRSSFTAIKNGTGHHSKSLRGKSCCPARTQIEIFHIKARLKV